MSNKDPNQKAAKQNKIHFMIILGYLLDYLYFKKVLYVASLKLGECFDFPLVLEDFSVLWFWFLLAFYVNLGKQVSERRHW